MKMSIGGLTAECTRQQASEVSIRMLTILEDVEDRNFEPSNIVIIDKVDGVFYEIIDGLEVKSDIPV